MPILLTAFAEGLTTGGTPTLKSIMMEWKEEQKEERKEEWK